MHTKEDQKFLDSLHSSQKIFLTSFEEFERRGNILGHRRNYSKGGKPYARISRNEYPHKGQVNAKVLRFDFDIEKELFGSVLAQVIDKYKDHDILIRRENERSVKRFHLHMYQ